MMHTRRGSVYLAVLATVSAVTVLSLTGIALRKSFNERARVGTATADAHRLARSGAELAIHQAFATPDTFREQAATGTVFSARSLSDGTIAASATDLDTNTTPTAATTRYRVVSDASVHRSRSRLAFTLETLESDYTTLARELGAVAYWPLDEATGTSLATDVIGGYNGTYNDPSRAGVDTHVHGNASPQNDWISHRTAVPHHSAFELEEGTIAFWVCWDALPTLPGLQMGAVSKELTTKDGSAHLAIYLANGNKLVAGLNNADGDGGITEATSVITAGTWHHIAVCWGSKLAIYVDGVLVRGNSTVKIGLAASNKTSANIAPWMFGVRNQTVLFQTPAYPTFGSVARVALFDSVLLEADIQDLYAASSLPGPIVPEQGSFARVVD
jgi:hypothetical protein